MLVVVERADELGVFVLKVKFRAGAAHEPPDKAGISHLLEHLLFKSADGVVQSALNEMGGHSNAATSFESTSYHLEVPIGEHARAARLMRQITHKLDFTEEELEREKEIVIEEKAYTESVREPMYNRMMRGTPYAKSLVGTRDTINGITMRDLRRYHRERYLNMGCFVGASCPAAHADSVRRALKKEFGRVKFPPRGPLLDYLAHRKTMDVVLTFPCVDSTCGTDRLPLSRQNDTRDKGSAHDRPPSKRTSSTCFLLLGAPVRKSVRDAMLDEFFSYVLMNGLGSVLMSHMRKDMRLTYTITGGHLTYTCANALQIALSSERDILFVLTTLQAKFSDIIDDGLVDDDNKFEQYRRAFKNTKEMKFATETDATLDLRLDELFYCRDAKGCRRDPDGRRTIDAALEAIDGFTVDDLNARARRTLCGPALVCLSGNNSTRSFRDFKDALETQMRDVAERRGLRLILRVDAEDDDAEREEREEREEEAEKGEEEEEGEEGEDERKREEDGRKEKKGKKGKKGKNEKGVYTRESENGT